MKAYFLWLAKFVTTVIVLCFLAPILFISAMVSAGKASEASMTTMSSSPAVAVVEVKGPIMSSAEVVQNLYKHANNDAVDAIVLRIDSPGGAVGPSQDINDAVKRLKKKKPIVASMGSVAASGGLYSAVNADKVYAQGGTLTGSIGVIMQIPNFAAVTDRFGVKMVTIKSGKLKDVGNAFRPMTDAEEAFLQETADTIHQEFRREVAEGRGLDPKVVEEFADGRVLVGVKAKELGLVDEIGGLREAARAAYELTGATLGEDESVRLIQTDDKIEALRKLFEAAVDKSYSVLTTGHFDTGLGSRVLLIMP